MKRAIKHWSEISKVVSTIHSESQYNRIVKMLDELIDDVNKKSDVVKESFFKSKI